MRMPQKFFWKRPMKNMRLFYSRNLEGPFLPFLRMNPILVERVFRRGQKEWKIFSFLFQKHFRKDMNRYAEEVFWMIFRM